MEEYIRLEEEKARRHAIVFNDALTSEVTLSCEPTVSPLNDNKIDFIISFDEFVDEDYKPAVSYFNDLDFFKDFENEFPAIIYYDALRSKLDFLTEPAVSPQHIDELDLKDEASLSECDEEEQNVLYFNDVFPFNVIYPDDSKSNKDNDDDKIDIKQSLGGNVKENQEKDKIESKPDKNRKRGEAGKSLKQLQWVEQEKLSKTQKEWPKTQTLSQAIQTFKERRKEMGQKCNYLKVQPQGPSLPTLQSCGAPGPHMQ
uniref:Reverse transcriptase domain-containing protein n=1 Tax=Tanacetum cinerariifolium TaxID=118510 RepID=A0A6L2MBH2_TANCI|nr:hypothetical protein [Tanacetum cinerariifolium]